MIKKSEVIMKNGNVLMALGVVTFLLFAPLAIMLVML
nr:MAG TPA: hypothetical protein [Caudoviricetes sp.]